MKGGGSRTSRVFLIAACGVVGVAGMRAEASILVPCLLAVFIVVIIAPVFLWLKERGIPGSIALVILISLIFWGWGLGPVGMLLSVPLTMAVTVALEDGEDTRWIAMLMGPAASEKGGASGDERTRAGDSPPDAGQESG